MIELRNVYKSFLSGRGQKEALVDISFSLESGKSMTLVGKSGSGKTTLLNCIGGIEAVDRGRITCFGTAIQEVSQQALSRFQRKHLGCVFQFGNLLSYLTIRENISFPLGLNNVAKAHIDARVRELLEKIGLPDAGPALPHELSGGEIQRVAVARAMAHAPRLLLADEPTASLDSATGKALIGLMHELSRDQGCTMIIATHDPELIAFSEETVQLRDGKIASA